MQFDRDMESKYRELFLLIRSELINIDHVIEKKTVRITSYSYAGSGLCHMRCTEKGVDIGFLKGLSMQDNYGQLKGKTKRMRVLSMDTFLPEQIYYYLNQAIVLNKK
jgi:hypothetical protein